MDVPDRPSTAHVAHGEDPLGVGMDDPGPDTNGDHWHNRHSPVRETVEIGGGTD